jgi:hypothetical protein
MGAFYYAIGNKGELAPLWPPTLTGTAVRSIAITRRARCPIAIDITWAISVAGTGRASARIAGAGRGGAVATGRAWSLWLAQWLRFGVRIGFETRYDDAF